MKMRELDSANPGISVQPKANSLWLGRQLFPMWRSVAVSSLLAIASGAASTLDPLLMRRLIDEALPGRDIGFALVLMLGIAGCFLCGMSFLITSVRIDFVVEQDVGQNLRVMLLEQLSLLSAHYHEETPAGDKMVRLQNDVDQVSRLASELISVITRATIFLLVNAIVMLYINARMTLAILPALLLFVWIQPGFTRSMRRRADVAQNETGRAGSVLLEYIAALPQLQLLGAESMMLRNAVSVWTAMVRARKSQRNIELLYATAIQCAFVLSILMILFVGGSQFQRGALTIGGLVAFYTYSTRIFEPVSSMLDVLSRLQHVGASIRRIEEVLSADQRIPDVGMIVHAQTRVIHGISVDHVTYGYSPDRPVLNDVSFEIAAGERIGIVGPSGSGKSTLARLLARLSDPESGDIRLDGHPIRDYSLAALRRRVSLVPQHPALFQGTVADNLRFAKPNATLAELKEVIAAVRLTEKVQTFPRDMDTELGPFGHGLSGGEQQRLSLARALLRSAPVLILDESTSALDLRTEREVLESVAAYCPHSILIIVSHRLTSLSWLDTLLVLNAGRVVAADRHENLYAGCTLYRSLYELGNCAPFVN